MNNDEELLKNEFISNPKIKIINNGRNVGFGAANNIGAKFAQGDILFFLNPDTEIMLINDRKILPLFTENEKLGIIGAQLRSSNNEIEKWSAGSKISLFNLVRNNLGWPVSQKFLFQQKPTGVDWVSAAALFIRRDVFEKVGGFDESFFMYFEDMDLCRRVAETQKEVMYFPKITVKHYGGESYLNKKKQKKDYYFSQKYYFRKHRNIFEWLIIKIASKLFYNV